MNEVATTTDGNLHVVSDKLALLLADEDTLPPDVCPEVVPAGWSWTGDSIDFEFRDGDWREVYILERDE